MTEQLANLAQTQLAKALGIVSSGTSEVITVTTVTRFPTEGNFRINLGGGELGLVTAVTGSSWTTTRGVESTTPIAHSVGQIVTGVLTVAAIEAVVEQSASGDVAVEKTAREAADATLATSIGSEKTRAEGVEATKATTTALTTETAAREAGDSTNAAAITTEKTRAETAENLRVSAASTAASAAQIPISESTTRAITWQSKIVIDARDYGVTVNGGVDATTALQNAINAASTAKGAVELPAGTIRLAGALTIKSNVELRGQGAMTLLEPVYAEANHAAVITNELETGNSNITLRNFRLSRAGSNVQHGILLNGVSNLNVDGVEIVGVPSVTSGALAVSGVLPGGSGATLQVSKDVRVRDCLFESANNFGVQLSYVTNATVTGCVFDNCYREAVGVEPQAGCTATNVSITGNTFTTGTVPSGGSATGVIVVTTSSGGTLAGVSVSGNTLTNTIFTATNTQPGINVLGINGDSKVTITGNMIVGMNGNGISVGNASIATGGVVISGNYISQCNEGKSIEFSGAGISLRQAFRCTITGNYIDGNHHTASIYESQSGAGRNLIIANHLLDTVAMTLLASGNTIARDNYGKATGSGGRLPVAANYTMLVTDTLIAVTSTSAAREITALAANAVPAGVVYTITDESNGAATHNIAFKCAGADTFTDGTKEKSITTNNGTLRVYSTGTQWQLSETALGTIATRASAEFMAYAPAASGDKTGVTDTTALEAAMPLKGILRLRDNAEYFVTKLPTCAPGQNILGGLSTTVTMIGTGTCWRIHNASFPIAGTKVGEGILVGAVAAPGGQFVINMEESGAGSIGVEIGDITGLELEGLIVANANKTGSKNWLFKNEVGWCERMNIVNCHSANGTENVVFTFSGESYSQSFDYSKIDIGISAAENQHGVVMEKDVQFTGCKLRFYGNCNTGVSANTGVVWKLGTDNTAVGIFNSQLEMQFEVDGSGVAHKTIEAGTAYEVRSYGVLSFGKKFVAGNITRPQSKFSHAGMINVDSNFGLRGTEGSEGLSVQGGSLWAKGFSSVSGGLLTLDIGSGDFFIVKLANGKNKLKLNKVAAGTPKDIILIAEQPSSGEEGIIEYSEPGNNSAEVAQSINWNVGGGGTPGLQKASSAIDILKFFTADGERWYPSSMQGVWGEAHIENEAVSANKIKAEGVVESKIGAAAVSTAKIKEEAITESKLANLSVGTGKIVEGAITTPRLQSPRVKPTKPAEGAVALQTEPHPVRMIVAALTGNGSKTEFEIEHKLKSNMLLLDVQEAPGEEPSGLVTLSGWKASGLEKVIVKFTTAPTAGSEYVVVIAA